MLRPPIAQERVTHGPDGLVRITLKKPFADGTVAVDMDPLSLLTRLAAAIPPPRLHTVRYAGVLAPASKLRARIVPKPTVAPAPVADKSPEPKKVAGSRYRPWAELLKRCFSIDVLICTGCGGRMRLVALVTESASVRRFLRGLGETNDAPVRAPARGPPYWKNRVLRRAAGETSVAQRARRDVGRVVGREETKDGAKDADRVTADVCASEPASCDETRSRARRVVRDDGLERRRGVPRASRRPNAVPRSRRSGAGGRKGRLYRLRPSSMRMRSAGVQGIGPGDSSWGLHARRLGHDDPREARMKNADIIVGALLLASCENAAAPPSPGEPPPLREVAPKT